MLQYEQPTRFLVCNVKLVFMPAPSSTVRRPFMALYVLWVGSLPVTFWVKNVRNTGEKHELEEPLGYFFRCYIKNMSTHN